MTTRFPTYNSLVTGVVTLSGSETMSGAKIGAVTVLASTGSSIAIDLSSNNNFEHTLTENTTLAAPSNPASGSNGIIVFFQHASSAKTLAFNSFWRFPGGTPAAPLTATTGSVDALAFYVPSSSFAICQMLNDIKV
jgi:hypothetical protein